MTKKAIVQVILLFSIFFIQPIHPVYAVSTFSIETDPATFLLDGYSLHFRFTPSSAEHWVFGAGIYAMEFPGFLRNIVLTNADSDLDLKLTHGYGLFSEYYLRADRQGWFVGGQVAVTQFELHNPSLGSDAHYTTLLIMPRIGYRWYPFQNRFYLLPWLGAGYTPRLSGETSVGSKRYHLSNFLPLFALHLGYDF